MFLQLLLLLLLLMVLSSENFGFSPPCAEISTVQVDESSRQFLLRFGTSAAFARLLMSVQRTDEG